MRSTFRPVPKPLSMIEVRSIAIETRPPLLWVCAAALALVLASPVVQALTLVPKPAYPLGGTPIGLATADLNSDGKLDLVTANRTTGSVSVLLGNGDGTFAAAVSYAAPNPTYLALGDLDGDGDIDLVVPRNTASLVAVRLNDGSGVFGPEATYSTSSGSTPFEVALGDFNGDGKADLVTADQSVSKVSILMGNGDGTFAAPVAYTSGDTPQYVIVRDVNGDGMLDLVVSNVLGNTVSVLMGHGDGTFAPAVQYPAPNPRGVGFLDLDNDGDPDLVVANGSSNTVAMRLNNGDGTFGAATPYLVGLQPVKMAVADLDADGRPELLVANSGSNTVTIAQSKGDGTLKPPLMTLAVNDRPMGIVVADFNGDGGPDLAVLGADSADISIFLATITVPDAPTIGGGTGGNAQISVAFTPPSSNGGSFIRDFTATCGSQSATGSGSPILVTGLTNGTPYTCTVVARNGAGASLPSAPTSSVVPMTVPSPPTAVVAAPGNAQISVAFTPAFNGGSAILDFTATCGSQSTTGSGSPIVVTGLTNGTPYTCTAVARNLLGTSSPSAPSNSVTPATVPSPPTAVVATPGSAQISVAFTPAFNGGSAILDFTATCGSQSTTGSGSPIVVTGLTNGAPYTCTVVARNALGTSVPSAPSNSAVPVTVPSPPTALVATAGNAQISVAFTPGFDGGSAILDFTATCGSQSITGSGSPIVVAGLTNGTPYTCTVAARNALGTSLPSALSNSVTPATVPSPPTAVVATPGNAQISVAFTPGFDGGSAILDFTATCGSQSITGSGSPIVVAGLTNGTPYTCTVVARNAWGSSLPSAPSNSATPRAVPSPPTAVVATPGNAQISVAFTPGFDGGSTILDFTATCGSQSITGGGSPIVVTGLANGTPYTCTVVARNAAGTSLSSSPSNSATPMTVPSPPTGVVATAGNAQISVAFTPAFDGGSAILDFTVRCGIQTRTGTGSPIVVTGLTNGTPCTCTVVARNAVGTSAPSVASTNVIPIMTSYSAASATGTGLVTASFTGGGAGCSYATARFIPLGGDAGSPPAGSGPTGVLFPHGLFAFTTVGCTPGSPIVFTITFPEVLSPNTKYWKYGPTPTDASEHWYVLPATITGNVASFSISDGALGDDDGIVNGAIIDQGGVGYDPGGIPMFSSWVLLLLVMVMMLTGVAALHRVT